MRLVIDNMSNISTFLMSKKGLIAKAVTVMSVIAAFYMAGISKDFSGYETYFSGIRNGGLSFALLSRFEPLFAAISFVVVLFVKSDLFVYLVFVVTAIWIKVSVIRQLAVTWSVLAIIVLFYGARFFPLFELTQIRVAIATSFILLAFLMASKDRVKSAVLFSLVSIGFHFSSFVFLPFILLRKWGVKSAVVLALLILLTLTFVKVRMLDLLSEYMQVIDMYEKVGYGDKVNPLSVTVILDSVMIAVGMAFWRKSSRLMQNVLVVQVVGLALFYAFLDYAVLAHRFREMLSVMWVLYLVHAVQERGVIKYFSYSFVIVNVGLYTYLFYFYKPIF